MIKFRQDLNLSIKQMAKYMGVSISTYTKWEKGARGQSAAVKRLVEVLRLIQTFCPSVHKQLIDEAKKNE